MSNTPSDTKTANLGFTIETRAGADVVVWKEGGCRPATSAEVAMWKALFAVQQPVVREPLTDGQAKEVLWTEHLRWMEAAGLDTEGMRPTCEWLDHWLAYVRAIERAHGITQKGGQHGADN